MSIHNPLNIEKWSISDFEHGKYSPVVGASNASPLKLHIPKLMPMIGFGVPTVSSVGLSKSCFVNGSAISVSSTTSVQNYLSVPQQDNRRFSLPIFRNGDVIMVEIHNKNPDTRFITTKVDNSRLV